MVSKRLKSVKKSKFDYPDRIYLIRGCTSREEIFNIGQQLYKNNKSERNNGLYTLYTIDLDKLPKNIRLFNDQNYSYGVYTTDNININIDAIIKKEKLNFKDDNQ